MTKETKPIMSAAETAAYLEIQVRTVSRLFERKAFPHARKLGTGRTAQLAIPDFDVIAYDDQQKKKLAAPPKKQ